MQDLLAQVLGQPLRSRAVDEATVYVGKLLDIELMLIPNHGLEDDGDVEFTRYSHQLQLTALDSGRFLSMESPVRNERRTPGSVRGARNPARGRPE